MCVYVVVVCHGSVVRAAAAAAAAAARGAVESIEQPTVAFTLDHRVREMPPMIVCVCSYGVRAPCFARLPHRPIRAVELKQWNQSMG